MNTWTASALMSASNFMSRSRGALLLGLFLIATVLLGYWGFARCDAQAIPACAIAQGSPLRRLLATLALVRGAGMPLRGGSGMQVLPPWQLVIAQYALLWGALAGTFYAALKLAVANLRRDVRTAMARRKRDHTVVCGLGAVGMAYVHNLRAAGMEVVAVDLATEGSFGVACDERHVPVIFGDATDAAVLRVAGVTHAHMVIACTGNDARNNEIALRAREIRSTSRRRNSQLLVFPELRDPWLHDRLCDHSSLPLGSVEVEIRPLNRYDTLARTLLRELLMQPAPDAEEGALLLVGFGTMGQELARGIIRSGLARSGNTPRITVVDSNVAVGRQAFLARNPGAMEVAALAFVEAELGRTTPESWARLEASLQSERLRAAIVCLLPEEASLHVGLELRDMLDRLGCFRTPVLVREERRNQLGYFFAAAEQTGLFGRRLRGFGALEEYASAAMLPGGALDALSIAWHERWLADLPRERQADTAARSWHELPERYKTASRRRADHVAINLAHLGYRIVPGADPPTSTLSSDEIEQLAAREHARWVTERHLSGWHYGTLRVEAQRLHPFLCDWHELPSEIRAREIALMAALPSLLSASGQRLMRVHRIAGFGSGAAVGMAALRDPPSGGIRQVIADMETITGREIARSALRADATELWVASRGDPHPLLRQLAETEGADFAEMLTKAAGWCRRDWLDTPESGANVSETRDNQ